jgi:hypothetical protein
MVTSGCTLKLPAMVGMGTGAELPSTVGKVRSHSLRISPVFGSRWRTMAVRV